MKVTAVKKLGKYLPGEEFEMPDKIARVFIRARKVVAAGTYQTRHLEAAPAVEVDSAGMAWDAKIHTASKLKNQDGTWRKRPVRSA